MRSYVKAAGVPAMWITSLDYFEPGPGKAGLPGFSPTIADGYVVSADLYDLLFVGMAALQVQAKTDNQQFQAGKRRHQPGSQTQEIAGNGAKTQAQEQKQQLGLVPRQVFVWLNYQHSIATTALCIR